MVKQLSTRSKAKNQSTTLVKAQKAEGHRGIESMKQSCSGTTAALNKRKAIEIISHQTRTSE